MDRRTRVLLEAPIASTLLRLAIPNMLVMLAQAAAGLVETYFIGKLGTDALAGVALVFPVVMLMQMMSAGAMGGGELSHVFLAQSLGLVAAGLINWAAVSGGAWFGSLTWPWSTAAAPQRRGSHASTP
jgi:Na+-driven multidrug efflux pump